jgi:hypothetical protein
MDRQRNAALQREAGVRQLLWYGLAAAIAAMLVYAFLSFARGLNPQ